MEHLPPHATGTCPATDVVRGANSAQRRGYGLPNSHGRVARIIICLGCLSLSVPILGNHSLFGAPPSTASAEPEIAVEEAGEETVTEVPTRTEQTPLPPRGASRSPKISGKSTSVSGDAVSTTLWSLGGVLLIMGAATYILRKSLPGIARGLPSSAVEVLGRKTLEPRCSVHLVRCGQRMLLLGSSPAGLVTLRVIDDPVEIDFLAGACRSREQQNPFQDFRAVFGGQIAADAETQLAPEEPRITSAPPAPELSSEDTWRRDAARERLRERLTNARSPREADLDASPLGSEVPHG